MTYLSNIVTIHITSSALFNADSDGFNIQNNIQKFGVEIGVSFDGAICTSSNSQITSDFLISENNSTSIFESNKQLNYLNYQQVPALHSNSDIFVDENTIIDDCLFIDNFKQCVLFKCKMDSEIMKLQSQGKIDSALDFIFDELDEKLDEKDFNLVNYFLKNLNIKEIDSNLLVGILTVTLIWKKDLLQRNSFFKMVSKEIENRFKHNVEAKGTLVGLE